MNKKKLPETDVDHLQKDGRYQGVAVLIPCYNEELTIGKVVREFAAVLPGATIFVFDNNSTDKTAMLGAESGAMIVHSPRQGKGNVVKHMFADVEADIYLMVDGDDTYPAASAPDLIKAISDGGVDMVVGARLSSYREGSFRRFHQFGNHLVATLISRLFSAKVTDVMSGYRAFSKPFVKSAPLISRGFEIETEMTLQTLAKHFIIKEIPIQYGKRPDGSHSKLNTFTDGFLVLKSLFMIFKDYKPLVFFSVLGLALFFITIAAGFLPVIDYMKTRFVAHVPLAILATGTGILTVLSFSIGLILDTISRYHNENFELIRRLLKK